MPICAFLEFLGLSNSQDDETPAKKKAAQGGGDEMFHKQRSKHFGGDGSQEEVWPLRGSP